MKYTEGGRITEEWLVQLEEAAGRWPRPWTMGVGSYVMKALIEELRELRARVAAARSGGAALTDEERLGLLQAAERQWNVRAPRGTWDLSGVRSPVEQEVERILAARTGESPVGADEDEG